MFNRDHARAVKNQIMSYNPYTTFHLDADGKMYVTAPKVGISDAQRELLIFYREELRELFTTPPDQTGKCWRCKKEIDWHLYKHGDWICSCYSTESAAKAFNTNASHSIVK